MPWYAVNRIGDIAAQQQRKKKDVHNFEKKYKSEDDKANESRKKKRHWSSIIAMPKSILAYFLLSSPETGYWINFRNDRHFIIGQWRQRWLWWW